MEKTLFFVLICCMLALAMPGYSPAQMNGGMMGGGGYGMMRPGYYAYSPECQKFYNDTAQLRKKLHDKRFEYFETLRNPKATGETAMRLEDEITELQDKIYAVAPLECEW